MEERNIRKDGFGVIRLPPSAPAFFPESEETDGAVDRTDLVKQISATNAIGGEGIVSWKGS